VFCLLTATANAQVTGDLNTNSGNTNSTIDSNNVSSSETKNYNGAGSSPFSTPVPTAAAPTVMGGGGNDSCLIPVQNAFQISVFGRAEGKMEQDPECNRRKDARLLGTPQEAGGLGLQVSGISVMCESPAIFKAMALASTPCPIYSLELPDVIAQENSGPTLSERFRRSRRSGNDSSGGVGPSDP